MISVIAPIKKVREEIDKIGSPIWIYCKRNLPKRKNHFYEESREYFCVDNNKQNIKENVNKILRHINHR